MCLVVKHTCLQRWVAPYNLMNVVIARTAQMSKTQMIHIFKVILEEPLQNAVGKKNDSLPDRDTYAHAHAFSTCMNVKAIFYSTAVVK